MRVRMKLSSVASLEVETRTALGRRPSVLEMEHSGVELERHKESSSKLHGSTLLKISVKWRRLAQQMSGCVRCLGNMTCRCGHDQARLLLRSVSNCPKAHTACNA